MTIRSRHALVGDIGGTHARFAISDIDELTISHFAAFRCAMFPSLEAAIQAYLASLPNRPRMGAIAIAGPASGETLKLTNLPWTFTREDIRAAAGIDRLTVVNDFEALAMSLPYLSAHDLHKIGGGEAVADAPRIVLGPGTGLGMAGLVPADGTWIAVGSEGGHVTFPLETAREMAIAERLRGKDSHLSAEDMISGPGLLRLYRTLAEMSGRTGSAHGPADITRLALARDEALAEEALELFVTWLGRFAGDMALAYGAAGGVYIGGGIAPHIIKALEAPSFRAAFEAKGRLSGYMAAMPVHVVKAADAGLRGAALALSLAVPA